VGVVVSAYPDVNIVREVDGRPLFLRLNGSGTGFQIGNQQNSNPQLFYESTDCTGTAFLPHLASNFFLPAPVEVAIDGTTGFYRIGASAVRDTNSYGEIVTGPGSCGQVNAVFTPPDFCCQTNVPGDHMQAEAATLDLTTLGVPPFHVDAP
jgi:hypothetical protein